VRFLTYPFLLPPACQAFDQNAVLRIHTAKPER
jgi:hypothetical protein